MEKKAELQRQQKQQEREEQEKREQALFNRALSVFFLGEEYRQGEGAMFALAMAAFRAGWQAGRAASDAASEETAEKVLR